MKWNPEVEDGHFKQQNTRMGICLNNPQNDYIYIYININGITFQVLNIAQMGVPPS